MIDQVIFREPAEIKCEWTYSGTEKSFNKHFGHLVNSILHVTGISMLGKKRLYYEGYVNHISLIYPRFEKLLKKKKFTIEEKISYIEVRDSGITLRI